MERPDLVRCEGAHDRMQDTTIMEEDEVLFVPIVRVDELW